MSRLMTRSVVAHLPSTNIARIVSCNPVSKLSRNHDIMGIFPWPLARGHCPGPRPSS